MYYLLICRSLTHAQRTVKQLEKSGITAVVTRAPQELLPEGCGYCVKLSGRKYEQARKVLSRPDLVPEKVFVRYEDGRTAEAEP